jgi:hypothetical protein
MQILTVAASAKRIATASPVATVVGVTGVVAGFLFWRQHSATQRMLLGTQAAMQAETTRALETTRRTLKDMDAQLSADLKRKDDLLQRLHVQNVEQSRSIDRLVKALKACQVEFRKPFLPDDDRSAIAASSRTHEMF